MFEVRTWLASLGLEQYINAFETNDIERDLLPELTDQTLKDIGVASAGHRLKILKAVREASFEDTVVPAQPAIHASVSSRDAERRQITVLFCDLVGSTALSEELDPEDLRSLMQAYQKACGTVVERYEGHVAQYLGDGLMVYFGWPHAHEDDAHRAVRTGLEIVDAIKGLGAPVELLVRVGIATGPVVVGETGDGDAAVPKAAVGETPNLAARIQSQAEPNTVAISDSTRTLIGGAFNVDQLGPQMFKGFSGHAEVYRIVSEVASESRFDAQSLGGLTPFVGREAEIAMLLARWQQAKEGEGQVVLLEGEPGIGKSRIVQVLRERLAEEPHIRLRYQCSPYFSNSAFYPIIEQFERAAAFSRDDTADQKVEKMEAALATGTVDVGDVAPLFASVLSLSMDRYPPLDLSPQKQKEETIAAFVEQVVGLAKSQPVLMIFEDTHWIDPSTLESLGEIIARIQTTNVLLVVTYRPEFEPPWSGGGHITALTLTRLSRRFGADMVSNILGGSALPDQMLEQIVAKTDGIPLFVEELTKSMVEAAASNFQQSSTTPAVPETLQDSLNARLDRLGEVKEIAQIGACIGRKFRYELLSKVVAEDDSRLGSSLEILLTSGLISQQGEPPNSTYSFKHALIQDAAYHSLLRSRRQTVHRKIAEQLELRSTKIGRVEPELLAHHWTSAAVSEMAVPHWLNAAKSAVSRSAELEAIAHCEQGLTLISDLPASVERDQVELALLLALGPALNATQGYQAGPVAETYERALELCRRLDDPPEFFPVLYGLNACYGTQGQLLRVKELTEEFLSVAQRRNDLSARVVSHRLYGSILLYTGEPAKARREFQASRSLVTAQIADDVRPAYGHDPRSISTTYLGLTLAILGYPDQAVRRVEDGVSSAIDIGHAYSICFSCYVGALACIALGLPDRTLGYAEKAMSVAAEQKFEVLGAWSRVLSGSAKIQTDIEQSTNEILAGISTSRKQGPKLVLPLIMMIYGANRLAAGDTRDGIKAIEEARSAAETYHETYFLPEILRVEGELRRAGGPSGVDAAEDCFRRSVKLARQQSARLWELRSTNSLARLLQSTGQTEQAGELLSPVFRWFTEGFDTRDLVEAKALLNELNQAH